MTEKEIKKMRERQGKKLEKLMSSPKELEKAAKKMYPKNWEVIFSGEKHPQNKRK